MLVLKVVLDLEGEGMVMRGVRAVCGWCAGRDVDCEGRARW